MQVLMLSNKIVMRIKRNVANKIKLLRETSDLLINLLQQEYACKTYIIDKYDR